MAQIDFEARGFVNLDVRCEKTEFGECGPQDVLKWEMHLKVNLPPIGGSIRLGPNVFATAVGFRAGFVGGIGANVALAGLALLQAELRALQELDRRGGPLVRKFLEDGPTALCKKHSNAN